MSPGAAAVQLVRTLRERGWSLAAAESLTAGLVTDAVAAVPGASAVLRGGVTAYQVDVKQRVLGVAPDLVAEHGVVSTEVAVAMARGVQEAMRADVGLATTGVAGPGPSDGVPAGRVCLAVALPDGACASRSWLLAGSRASVRRASARLALALALAAVSGSARPGEP